MVLPVTPFPVLAFLNKSTKSANLKRLFNTFHSWVMNIVINSIALPPSPGSSEYACYLYGIYTVVMVVFDPHSYAVWLTLDTSEKESNWYHFVSTYVCVCAGHTLLPHLATPFNHTL